MKRPRRLPPLLGAALALLAGTWPVGCDGPVEVPVPEQPLRLHAAAAASGDLQTDTVEATLVGPLRVVVTRGGTPVRGVSVVWTVAAGTGRIASSTVTDDEGVASAIRVLGAVPGVQRTTATADNSPDTVVFVATARPRPLRSAIVSDTVTAPSSISGSTSTGFATPLVYVSLPPGTFPGAYTATVRDRRTGSVATGFLEAGGLDPLAIAAWADDTLELEIRVQGVGEPLVYSLTVGRGRRPVVVRTDPPPRRRDLPLNVNMLIVFSEPIRPVTVTSASVRLLRAGTPVPVQLTLSPDGLRLQVRPDSALASATDYTLFVDTLITDLDGQALAAPMIIELTTGAATTSPVSLSVTPTATAVEASDGANRPTVNGQFTATLRDAGGAQVAGTISWRSSDTLVVVVDSAGRVRGGRAGAATITATAAGLAASANVTVLPQIVGWTGPTDTTLTVGTSACYVMTPRTSGGAPATGYLRSRNIPPHLSLERQAGDTVCVRADLPGDDAIITYYHPADAGWIGGMASTRVRVPNPVTIRSIALSADTLRLVYAPPQYDAWLRATVRDSSGAEVPFAHVAWSSSDQNVVWVNGETWYNGASLGALAVRERGRTWITAVADGRRDSTLVIVGEMPLTDVSVGPGTGMTSGMVRGSRCYLTATGEAYCGGPNDFSGLGPYPPDFRHGPQLPVQTPYRFTAVATGRYHACALTAQQEAICWGEAWFGQLGRGVPGAATDGAPLPVATTARFRAISAGADHTCALDQAGAAWCWGGDRYGQTGTGGAGVVCTDGRSSYSSPCVTTPTRVAGGLAFVQISAGLLHTCALTAAGAVYCWGRGSHGELGGGATGDRSTPVLVAGGQVFSQISAGGLHTCALTAAGAAWCWGWGASLGLDSLPHPAPVSLPMPGGAVLRNLDAGHGPTCGVTDDGTAWCWGFHYQWVGMIYDEPLVLMPPTAIPGPMRFTRLDSGEGRSCGRGTDGRVYCLEQYFALTPVPVLVPGQP